MPKITSVTTHEEYTLKTHDPYGFVLITKTEAGATPQELSGAYTGVGLAKMAIDAYKNKMKMKANQKREEKELPENFKEEYKKRVLKAENKKLKESVKELKEQAELFSE